MAKLWSAFWSGLASVARPAFAQARSSTEAALREHLDGAHHAWPSVHFGDEDFACELANRLGAEATLEALQQCHAADLYLAVACCRQVARAIRVFEVDVAGEVVARAGRHTGATEAQAADALAWLLGQLFVDEPGRLAACRGYRGRSSLRRYVTVIATRELVRVVRLASREVTADDLLEAYAEPGNDPERSLLLGRYQDEVAAGFRVALDELSERSRATLRFKLVHRWRIAEVARLYGVSVATAHRRLIEARDELGDRVRAEVARRLALSLTEVDAVVRLVQGGVELPIERL